MVKTLLPYSTLLTSPSVIHLTKEAPLLEPTLLQTWLLTSQQQPAVLKSSTWFQLTPTIGYQTALASVLF